MNIDAGTMAIDTREPGRAAVIGVTTAPGAAGLTRRAGLLWIGTMLQQVIRFAAGFLMSPLIVRSLGVELYGAWTMIQQSTGYLTLSDMRPAAALRIAIGTTQHVTDEEARRRQIGAAAIVWLRMLPLIAVFGAGLVWLAPSFIRVSGEHRSAVYWAMALSVVAVAVDQILAIPGNILRGLNLDYKATIGRCVALILTFAATAVILLRGGGLVGVAAASILAVVCGGGAYLWTAVRELRWLGVSRPLRAELQQFTHMTIWLFLNTLGTLLLNASDLMVVGYLLGPRASAVYAATGAVLRLAIDPLHSVIAAANPGVIGLCGKGEWTRVERIRIELHLVVLFATVILGVGVVCLNASFLSLWLGHDLFGGGPTNLLLVLLAFQMVPLRSDLAIVDGMTAYRARSIVMCSGGALSLLVGVIGVHVGGLAGMAGGTFAGRMVVVAGLAWVIRRQSGIGIRPYLRVMGRPIGVGLLLLAVGVWFPWHPARPLEFALAAVAVGSATTAAMWQLGLGASARQIVSVRIVHAIGAVRR